MLTSAIEKIVLELQSRSRNLAPKYLYHFTTAEAFMGICKNNEIWLGDVRFMNDPSELSFGQQVAYRALEYVSGALGAERAVSLIKDALSGLSTGAIHQPMIFAFSLCRHGDSLAQWRQYGDQGRGYSIGFRSKTLISPRTNSALGLFRVRYLKSDQEEIFHLFYSLILNFCETWDGVSNRDKLLRQVAMGIAIISAVMKDRSYQTELEWRLVVALSAKGGSEIKFMAKRSSIKPYIVRKFDDLFGSDRSAETSLIDGVTIGPVLEPIVKQGVEMMLDGTEFSGIDVKISEVPIRDVL